MKKYLMAIAALLAFFTPCAAAEGEAAAAAGEDFTKPGPFLGVRAGMGVTFPSGGHQYLATGAGLNLGLVYNIPLGSRGRWYFEPGVMFSYMAMDCNDYILADGQLYEGVARDYAIAVPLNFGYRFSPVGRWQFGVYTGPMIYFNLAAKERITPDVGTPVPEPDVKINLFDKGWRRVDAGWGFGLTATFAGSYFIGITGGVAFTPLAVYGNRDNKVRVHRNTIALSLGYNF